MGPDLDTTSYDYTNELLSKFTTPEGRQAIVTYDTSRRAASVTQVTNPTAGFAYSTNTNGERVVVLTDPNSNDTTYTSSPEGRMITVEDAAGKTRKIGYTPPARSPAAPMPSPRCSTSPSTATTT